MQKKGRPRKKEYRLGEKLWIYVDTAQLLENVLLGFWVWL